MHGINGFIVLFTLCALVIVSRSLEEKSSKVLIMGGNGLLGSATVRSLLNDSSVKYDITIVNRGNWYWDTEKIIKPFVKHIQCTRGDGFRESCEQLHNSTFDTIIDFSCYDSLDIEDILLLLEGNFKRYIYISTDSVYEVSKPKIGDGYSKEEDSVRPENETRRVELNLKDVYGHKKLEGEEVLNEYHKERNYEFISLRLPDVLGPRDNTLRFYKYFIWTKLHEVIGPVHIPKDFQEKPISFVFSLDAASLISSLANPDYDSSTFNKSYNLAFTETITLKQFVTHIGKWLRHNTTKLDESDLADVHHGFPSVLRGPINVTKATTILNWSPTNIYTALDEICEFYEMMQYDNDYKHILDRVLDKLDVKGDKYRAFIDLHWKKLKRNDEL